MKYRPVVSVVREIPLMTTVTPACTAPAELRTVPEKTADVARSALASRFSSPTAFESSSAPQPVASSAGTTKMLHRRLRFMASLHAGFEQARIHRASVVSGGAPP